MVNVELPDGSRRQYEVGATALTVAADISEGLARSAVAATVDDALCDMSAALPDGDCKVALLTSRDDASLEILRHTAAHVLAMAVVRVYGKDVQYTIGPALMDDFQYGFYYDFDLPEHISTEDLAKIEAEMKKIVKEKLPIERVEMSADEARAEMKELGQSYKGEMIADMLADDPDTSLSFYRQGEFLDMCRGPHLPDTGKLGKAFKLL
ncbi:MAG: TGS domain-containing protein, partial [Phycisphaerae bacterium]|nr:TGS domain-containing protein [Phycisphaerae bacterium]